VRLPGFRIGGMNTEDGCIVSASKPLAVSDFVHVDVIADTAGTRYQYSFTHSCPWPRLASAAALPSTSRRWQRLRGVGNSLFDKVSTEGAGLRWPPSRRSRLWT
jgi:hypothetical protein